MHYLKPWCTKKYIDVLFRELPTAYRTKEKDWRLFDQSTWKSRPYSIISVGAFKYRNVEEMVNRMNGGKLDAIFAFDFGQPTVLHVLQKRKDNAVDEVLKQVQLNLQWLKVQIH